MRVVYCGVWFKENAQDEPVLQRTDDTYPVVIPISKKIEIISALLKDEPQAEAIKSFVSSYNTCSLTLQYIPVSAQK